MNLEVTREDVEAAADRVRPHIRLTPTVDLGDIFGAGFNLTLKLDHLQPTGSFKVRGAFSLLTAREIPEAGVVAASGGNFGLAVAYACSRLGHPSTIFVPDTSPPEKIDRIGQYGADVRVIPGYYDKALSEARAWADGRGAFQAHAYDQPEVVAGQGTAALEITTQVPDADAVLVAVGGGGLIGGIASWCREDVAVVSTEPTGCPSMHAARQAGAPARAAVGGVAASSLGAERIGDHAWFANRWIDDAVLVTDDQIIDAQRWLWREVKLAVEPAAATTIAAFRTGVYQPGSGSRVVAMISGANVDPATII
jgi:threonine dehydratase